MDLSNDISSLIAIARNGDHNARDQLLGYYRDYLRLLAQLHVQPLLKAKFGESDIVQETCMQAIVDFDQFRGENEKQFAAWLRKILANKGAWMARKYHTEKRDARLELDLQHQIDQSSVDLNAMVPDKYACPSQVAIGRERVALLADAITKLKGDQREVLIMHGLQHVSVPDVAKALGRTEASTWKLWARGLLALQKALKEIT